MVDLMDLHTVAQLLDNLEIITGKLEEEYNKKDAERFNLGKKEILEIQKNIDSILTHGN